MYDQATHSVIRNPHYVAPVVASPAQAFNDGGGGDSFGGFNAGLSMGSYSDGGFDSPNAGVTGPGGNAAGVGSVTVAQGGQVYSGGIASLAKGGMRNGGFILAADIPSAVGEGNTEAGYREIAAVLPGAMPIRGKDKGQADTVKTSIEGKQPARVAHGEMYVPPEAVKKAGGAKKLYAMMDNIRKQATGNKKQIKPVNIKKALA
jgi:hypothetical protein